MNIGNRFQHLPQKVVEEKNALILHQRKLFRNTKEKEGISHVRDACEAKMALAPLTSMCQCGWGPNVDGTVPMSTQMSTSPCS